VLIPLGRQRVDAATGEIRRTGGAGESRGTTSIVGVDFAVGTTIIVVLWLLLHPIAVCLRCLASSLLFARLAV
jgi:hypothetical protein